MKEPLRVLIAEDNPADAELIVQELRRAGFDPEWHVVDTEADYLSRLHPDLDVILSDYGMPQFNASRALELAHERGFDVPFIIVSGTIGEDVAVEAMKQGAADYLLKDRLARLGPAIKRAMIQTRLRKVRALTEDALRESEERFREVVQNIGEVFWMTDVRRTHMIFVSAAFEKIWGRTCASLHASLQAWTDAIHPEDRERVLQSAASQNPRNPHTEEYRIVRPDGSVRWICNRACPVRNTAGIIYRIAGVAEDITVRKQLEEQYRQSQKMEAIGQLATGVAHDFNNLLTVIQGNASLILMDKDADPAAAEHAEQIVEAAGRAAGLTRQLLLFSRRQVMQPANLDLNEVVGNMTRMLQRMLGEDIALRTDFSPNLPPIHADPGMIEQILLNLAVNSRDAMPSGGSLTVSTGTEILSEKHAQQHREARPGPYVCLSFTDTGCGILPEILPRIFEPFFTTKEVGKGTGLGLATVYGIVNQHRGWIAITSEPGQGTAFRICFPVAAGAAGDRMAAPPDPALPGGRETILLVEDEALLRMMVQRVLEQCGHTVLCAVSGVNALEIWQEHRDAIQLVVTDMMMPGGVSGRELGTRLITEKPGLQVIYTSGFSAELAGKGMALKDGVNFLQKPWDLQKLVTTVRACLDGA